MTAEEKLAFERNNNRLLTEKLAKKEKEKKLLLKEITALNSDIADYKEAIENRDFEIKRCTNCKHLCDIEIMTYVGNEEICENCRTNGFGE